MNTPAATDNSKAGKYSYVSMHLYIEQQQPALLHLPHESRLAAPLQCFTTFFAVIVYSRANGVPSSYTSTISVQSTEVHSGYFLT